ncbi:TPA: phage tail protein [Salmonella enterica subsp. enterica serovar Saintpaul]
MPSTGFEKKENGRYATHGLSATDFLKVFNKIRKGQRASRRGAHRTLTPAGLRNKSVDEILKLGKKKDGTFFTPEDLKQFIEKRAGHRTKFSSDQAGITYAQLVAMSTQIDVKRANNKVDDGTGIKSALFIRIRHNIADVKVTASDASVDDNHLVRVRFEEWDRYVEDVGDEKVSLATLAKNLAKGRVSFDCDCGRHQYWFRYMATAGNYALKPPAEYAFPKIRNPDLVGAACKHVLHVMTRFQSSTWQRQLGTQMKKAAEQVAFGDDKKRTTKVFTDKELKALARNRSDQTDQTKIRREFEKYQAAQRGLAKVQRTEKDKIDRLRKQASTARNSLKRKAAELKTAQAENALLKKQQEAMKAQLQEQLKLKKQGFIQAMKITGMTDKQAETAFKKWLASQQGKQ